MASSDHPSQESLPDSQGLVQRKNKYLGNSNVADWTVSFDLKFRSPTYLLIYIRLFLPISPGHSFPLFLPISLVHILSLCTKMAGGVAVSTHPGRDYPGKMTVHVMVACLIAAFGGLIFGYDIGISGGVTSMTPFLKKFFPSVYQKEIGDKSTNQYCKFDSAVLTLFTSSLYIAALISSCFASIVTKKLGRKATMFWGGLVFLVGAVLNGLASNIAMLIIGRLCLGVGVGFANQSVPVYLSEIAPSKYRGALNVTFQLMITIGNFGANIVNYFTDKIENGSGWRWSLGGAAVPALMITVGSLFLTDTPNSLLDRNKPQEAKSKLRKIRGIDNVDEEYNDIVAAGEASRKVDAPWSKLFFDRKYRPSVVMAFMIPMFQQITGINVIMFYAPVLFKTLGFGGTAALMSACITGGVNALATIVSIVSVDRLGRRALLLEGGTQMLIFQFIVGGLIANKFGVSGNVTNIETGYAMGVVACICIYVAGFAWSWGPLGWLVPSEIFPLEVRPAAQSITVSVNMFFTFIIAEVFLKLLCVLKFGLFFLFGGCTVMMTFFVYFLLPETKGVPIEEMSARVWKKHWYWGKFIPDENAYELKENKGYPQV